MVKAEEIPKEVIKPDEQDFLPLNHVDHIEFYVGNAKQAAYYYQSAFGFQPVAYAGLETGVKDRMSFVLGQNNIRFVVTSALDPDSPVAEHARLHGDGVKVVAFDVDDAEKSYNETVNRGAKSYMKPKTLKDGDGEVKIAGIYTYGETVHLFVDRSNYNGLFLPNYQQWDPSYKPNPVGLQEVDHVVGNVELGKMNEWAKFYADVMGFKQMISFDDKDISTKYTALMSKVMSNGSERIKFPLNEPAEGKKKSQIDEYLEFYKGPGVQHIAISTNNIIETVGALTERGVDFLYVPDTYYENLTDRVGEIDEEISDLKKYGILVDRDDEGYLLQLFTKPIQDRPTVFIEVIQRKGARSFGKGNFKALFEAIEREQEQRGTL